MSAGTDVVLVSDRGPVTLARNRGQLVPCPSRGGLVSTLTAAARSIDGTVAWISTTTSEWDGRVANEWYPDRQVLLDCVCVDPDEYWRYYDDAGVRLLWYAHHDLWGELGRPAGLDVEALRAYERVNDRLAERAVRACRTDTPVLFQDYQLAAAPRRLRSLAPDQPVAYVTCTPFGPVRAFAHLPGVVLRTIVDGMLGADLVGFLHRPWADEFLACCRSLGLVVDVERGLVQHSGGRTWVRYYPLGVELDPEPDGEPSARGAVRTIVRADRLDPAKNVLRGFQAFELLLQRRPDLRRTVVFASYPVPSRERITEYRSYTSRLAAEVDRISARFPGAIQIYEGTSRRAALDAMRDYDVLIVNSLRDGMNLVAQEGPMVNARGCVVLSAMTGSAGLLRDDALILADPRDISATADLLERALAMPAAERHQRVERMRVVIGQHRPERWIADQLADLSAVRRGATPTAGTW